MKLTTKLMLTFLSLSLIPIAIVGYLAYDNGQRSLKDDTFDHLESVNTLKAEEFDRWINDVGGDIRELARRPLLQQDAAVLTAYASDQPEYVQAQERMLAQHFSQASRDDHALLELFVLDPDDGRVLVSTNRDQEERHLENRSYFVEGKKDTYIQSVYYSASLDSPAMTVGTPLRDIEGNLIAVLAGRVDLKDLSEFMSEGQGGSRSQDTYLVNEYHLFVTNPRLGEGYALKESVYTEGASAALAYGEGVELYKDYKGTPVIGAYRWLPEHGLAIITEIEQSEALAPVNDLRTLLLTIAGAIAVVVVLLALFFSRSITRPVHRLAEGVAALRKGDLDYRVRTSARDEIGALSRGFDQMVEDLKETTVSRDALRKEVAERARVQTQLDEYRIELEKNLAELQEAYEKLHELDQMKDTFLSTVSHELRTPLTSIKSFAEILLTYDDDRETQKEFLGIINDESDRLTRLINDFLDLAKIEAGRMQWENEEVKIGDVIRKAVGATQSLSSDKRITVETDIDGTLPLIEADGDRLIQVVTNLISNAVKFTPDEGTITIVARSLETDEDGIARVKVSVSDTGIGISPKDQKHVFEKFRQVGDTLRDKPQGTGLGLPISKEIVEHFNGTIGVESQLGHGSTFYFILPAMAPVAALAQSAEAALTPVSRRAGSTILVVEDEANIRRFLSHELTDRGFHVLEATGGQAAIDAARRYQPDLITLDVLMPDMNGFDVTATLKDDPSTRDIPILIVSVLEEKEKASRLGANDYVIKPFDMETLMQKVRGLLRGSQKSVLVVDDDPMLVKLVEEELQKRGFVPLVSHSMQDALDVVGGTQPDLLLLDMMMPEAGGDEVIRALRGNPETADIPVLLMFGMEEENPQTRVLEMGADGHFIKSGQMDSLMASIDDILKRCGGVGTPEKTCSR